MTTPAVGGGSVSPLIRQQVNGLFTVSDFESKSHDELRAMVEHASPSAAAELSRKLTAAAEAVSGIAEDLKAHTAHVEWEGEGGEAFRMWGADLANAAQRLAHFSSTTGTWMGHAAETLTHVHGAMPEVSAGSRMTLDAFRAANPGQVGAVSPPLAGGGQSGGLQGRGPTQQEAYAAQQRLDADHAEAARLMRQLAESYAWSAHNVQGAERPVFPAISGKILPKEDGRVDRYVQTPRDSKRVIAGANSSPTALASGLETSGHQALTRPQTAAAPDGVRRLPDQPAFSRIDGVATAVPQALTETSSTATASLPSGSASLNMVPAPSVSPRFGNPRGLPAGTAQGLSRTRAVEGTSGRVSPGQTEASEHVGRVPNRAPDGIVGGRPAPRPGEQPRNAIPRGTVIGAEPQQGGGRASTLPGPSTASPAGRPSNQFGNGGGRRLASEPGGTVGGQPHQGSQTANRPFTPGGTGLTSERRSNPQRGQRGRRPDYLVEDEETWNEGHRRVVPPVID